MSPATLAHYLGIVPTWVDNTQVGGTSFLIHMRHAAAAIASGLATTILCCMGQSGRSRVGVGGTRIGTAGPPTGPMYDGSYPGQFESIYGVLGPTTQFGMGVLRFMKETGNHHRAARVGGRRSAQVVQQGPACHVSGSW